MASKEFRKWCDSNGVRTYGLEVREFAGLRGVGATRDIPAGTVTATIPLAALFSLRSARQDAKLQATLASLEDPLPDHIILSVYLLLEASRGSSSWRPYLRTLPRTYTILGAFPDGLAEELQVRTPLPRHRTPQTSQPIIMFWFCIPLSRSVGAQRAARAKANGAELSAQRQVIDPMLWTRWCHVQAPHAVEACHAEQERLRATYAMACPLLRALELSTNCSNFDAWCFAAGALSTRCMYLPGDTVGCLSPFADMHNYHPPPPPFGPRLPGDETYVAAAQPCTAKYAGFSARIVGYGTQKNRSGLPAKGGPPVHCGAYTGEQSGNRASSVSSIAGGCAQAAGAAGICSEMDDAGGHGLRSRAAASAGLRRAQNSTETPGGRRDALPLCCANGVDAMEGCRQDAPLMTKAGSGIAGTPGAGLSGGAEFCEVRGEYRFAATKDYARGEEVFLCYGHYTSLVMLTVYGFLLTYNPHDEVLLPAGSWPEGMAVEGAGMFLHPGLPLTCPCVLLEDAGMFLHPGLPLPFP
jgi:hypothetical protein